MFHFLTWGICITGLDTINREKNPHSISLCKRNCSYFTLWIKHFWAARSCAVFPSPYLFPAFHHIHPKISSRHLVSHRQMVQKKCREWISFSIKLNALVRVIFSRDYRCIFWNMCECEKMLKLIWGISRK